MEAEGAKGRAVRVRGAILAAGLVLVALVSGCASSSDSKDSASSTVRDGSGTIAGSSTSAVAVTTLPSIPGSTTTTTTGFEDATDGARSAPATGPGTAQLKAVRVGRNVGFERIVFEFEGSVRPGYRIRWTEGVVTEDGSGDVVTVAGIEHLEMSMEPASGFDMETSKPSYTGPDRIAVTQQTKLLRDLVRTGDFEGVLTWVAGSSKKVPYRVQTLQSPTRLVIDVQTA